MRCIDTMKPRYSKTEPLYGYSYIRTYEVSKLIILILKNILSDRYTRILIRYFKDTYPRKDEGEKSETM
jgi:hypothetical protein